MKAMPSPFSLAYKKRTYSPNRIKYPLKRVDWDPNGERNTQNRGKSKFVRISWDEATDLIAAEIRRIHKEYGPCAILVQGDGHGECKIVHAPHGCSTLLLDKMGGFTQQVRNPDSWEGWYWGAKHVWGTGLIGMMSPADNIVKDISENTRHGPRLGRRPGDHALGLQRAVREPTPAASGREIGIKQVYICPDLNYAAAVHADKWIPVLPNTDAALQLAIMLHLDQRRHLRQGVRRNPHRGLRQDEGLRPGRGRRHRPRRPKWASPKCGVPEWTIKALARDWAKKTVTIGHYFGGGMVRGPYSTSPPGWRSSCSACRAWASRASTRRRSPTRACPRTSSPAAREPHGHVREPHRAPRPGTGCSSRTQDHADGLGQAADPEDPHREGDQDPPVDFWGTGGHEVPTADQFEKYTYPIPKEEGGTEIHMIWTDTPCRTTCWNCGNDVVETMRSPKIEFILAQHPWLENDCLYADIVLPISTTLEVDDISPCIREGDSFQSVLLMDQAIAPVGESKSDYEAVCEIAKKLGHGRGGHRGQISVEELDRGGLTTAWGSTQ